MCRRIVGMTVALAHISFCHSVGTELNQLTGSIPSELGGLTSMTDLDLSTWIIGVSFVGMIVVVLAHISLPF
jgi:hypothetical protein